MELLLEPVSRLVVISIEVTSLPLGVLSIGASEDWKLVKNQFILRAVPSHVSIKRSQNGTMAKDE